MARNKKECKPSEITKTKTKRQRNPYIKQQELEYKQAILDNGLDPKKFSKRTIEEQLKFPMRPPYPKRGAPPGYKIDFDDFEKLCALHCTITEIAGWFKLKADDLIAQVENYYQDKYGKIYERYAANGKIRLRRTQIKLSEKSTPMAIWLGKNMLGQKDVVTNEHVMLDKEQQIIQID